MNFLELLEAAKAKAGSYKAVAERLNVDAPKLSEWKKGKYKPTSEHVVLLAEIAQLPELETLVEVQREINQEQAMVWERLLRKMGPAAAKAGAAFLVLGVIFLGVAPENSQARQALSDKAKGDNACGNIYIVASYCHAADHPKQSPDPSTVPRPHVCLTLRVTPHLPAPCAPL